MVCVGGNLELGVLGHGCRGGMGPLDFRHNVDGLRAVGVRAYRYGGVCGAWLSFEVDFNEEVKGPIYQEVLLVVVDELAILIHFVLHSTPGALVIMLIVILCDVVVCLCDLDSFISPNRVYHYYLNYQGLSAIFWTCPFSV